MYVAEMFTRLAFMVASVRVREPLGSFVGVGVMRLMKASFIDGLCSALHTHEEHGGDHQLENDVTHDYSVHKACR